MTLVAVSGECRRVIREARQKLGVSQGALEKSAQLGKTYVWYVESGQTRSTDAAHLGRLLRSLHKQAVRAQAPAKLCESLLKAVDALKQGGRQKK